MKPITVDFLRVTAILAVSAVVGFTANALSAKPLDVFDRQGPGAPPTTADRLSISELGSLLKTTPQDDPFALVILDARTKELYDVSHPPDAVFFPPSPAVAFAAAWTLLAERLLRAQTIVIYCDSNDCWRGDLLAKRLTELNVRKVKILDGGWAAYRKTNLPVENKAAEKNITEDAKP